ncbi:MAG: HlyD family efflux transporter periplasmic adaptor subunit [Planctomycetales bacterium]
MQIGELANNMLTSTQRPVPLQARSDLVVKRIQYLGATSVVVKDPVALKYYRFQPEQFAVLELLDGERNLEEIRDEFHNQFPTVRITITDLQNLITDLHRSRLVYSNRMGQGAALLKHYREERRKKIWQTIQNFLYIRLPGWDPERTLVRIHPYFKWMFEWWGVAVCMLLVVSAWALVGMHFTEFQSRLPRFQQFFGWPNLMYLWVVLGASKIIHEFGHGLTCKHFRGECHEMGMLLLCLSPCLYCDVSDSWLLENKWKRIMIGAAGMYIEVILSALAIWGWWYSREGLFHYLCLNLFFVSTISTVIFNANPLLKYDGYYMMSDWLEIPNLRPKADKLLSEKFGWYCLGIEAPHDPFMPQSGQGWFVFYAIAAWLYRWVVMYGIILFFYTFLKPYGLQSIGIFMAVMSLVTMIGGLIYKVYKMVTAPRIDPLSRPKMIVSGTLLVLIIVGILKIPIWWNLEAPMMIEPEHVQHVYATVPGRLEKILVKPGEMVHKGQMLMQLSDPEKEARLKKLETDIEIQNKELDIQHRVRNFVQFNLAKEKLEGLNKQKAELTEQLAQLTIYAPCDGKVVAAPRTAPPKRDPTNKQLGMWNGSPLEPINIGATMQARAHLLSIAPNDRFQAMLFIDQGNRNDFHVGQDVRLKLDHLANDTYRGKIVELAQVQSDFAPQPLSNKSGGDVSTVTDKTGRERLTSVAYEATVAIDQDLSLLRSGMRGRARCTIDSRSLGQWLWRYFRQTFHFRL